jgi:hypothetical protein
MILWANLSIENPVKLIIRSGKENLHKHEKQGEKRNRQDLGGNSNTKLHPIQKQNLQKVGN